MSTSTSLQKAVLVGIQIPQMTSEELQGSLAELTRLVTTLGYEVVGEITQKRSSERAANLLGEGKLKELAQWTGGPGIVGSGVARKKTKAELKRQTEKAPDEEPIEPFQDDEQKLTDEGLSREVGQADLVIVDCDLSPSQLRNLERACGCEVLDRTGVIIEIFSRHARTRAARLQVEIARLTYTAPRLRETGGGSERQGGGIGGKGAGETSLELDKRKIRDRIKELKAELASIGNEHQTRTNRRSAEICVALVGYTNAGKSSLMRAMTGSEVLVADKLFATLDTTIRPLYPESRPKILISDTVGFIKKLPHDLVASFKSTLDEALNASVLLFVVDGSDPAFRSQLKVTQDVLTEVGAGETEHFLILNKRDRLSPAEVDLLKREFPHAIFLSTRDSSDIKTLREFLIGHFETDMIEEDLLIPYKIQGVVGEVRAKMRVVKETYNENGVILRVRAKADRIEAIRRKLPT